MYESKFRNTQEQQNVQLISRLLLGLMKTLDPVYRTNNFQKFLSELIRESHENYTRCYNRAYKSKTQLMRSIDASKMRIRVLKEENLRRCKTFQRILVREFLNKLTLPICMNYRKSTDIEGEIVVQLQEKCPASRAKYLNQVSGDNLIKLVG